MRQKGFTLIELLVAITITVVMVGMMLVITRDSLGLWTRTQSQASMVQAQLALDQIEYDIQGTIMLRVGEDWISVHGDEVSLTERGWIEFNSTQIKPTSGGPSSVDQISETSFGRGGHWLRLFSSTPGADSEGYRTLPTAISYQINRRMPGSDETTSTSPGIRYMLMRSEMSEGNTINILDTAFDTTSILKTPTWSDALAVNVVDFGIWFFARADSGTSSLTPINQGAAAYNMPQVGEVPTEAIVMLRILSDQGATLVENIEQGRVQRPTEHNSIADWWWAVVIANSEVYVRHINLVNAPL